MYIRLHCLRQLRALSVLLLFLDSCIIFFKALIADIHNMQPIFPCKLAEDDRVYLDSLHVLAAHQESHILKALEGVGGDVLLHILPGITAFLVNAGGFLCDHPMCLAVLIEVNKVVHHIRQGNSAIAVHILINRFEQDRLIGEAHIHRFNEFHELICHILRCDEIPAVLLGNVSDTFFAHRPADKRILFLLRFVRKAFRLLYILLRQQAAHRS